MKDPRDADRQRSTVQAILSRFFSPDFNRRRELQILADEVGMGKTYIALGVAYSILQTMQDRTALPELAGCYRKVLILTPQNQALFTKWLNETGEFVSRCVKSEFREQAKFWFKAIPIERIDQLSVELRRSGNGPRVLIARTSLFSGVKLTHYDLKRRWLLGLMFKYWGNRLSVERRERLLKGAEGKGWPKNPYSLLDLLPEERQILPFDDGEALNAISILDQNLLESLLDRCREISEKFVRNRDEHFKDVDTMLIRIYKELTVKLIRQSFPLVIVDEAHNWKNGPENGANGFFGFRDHIACRTKRVLLLTATPFQLHPNEMLELLRITDYLAPEASKKATQERQESLKQQREEVLRPVLSRSAKASQDYSKAWGRLPRGTATDQLRKLWLGSEMIRARIELSHVATCSGVVSDEKMRTIIVGTVTGIDPSLREFFREALKLYTYNCDLSQELGEFVIRHRRRTEHRLFKVGCEFNEALEAIAHRPDRHLLHPALGMDVKGDAELPHFLLMRCVSEMKWNEKRGGRSSLGSDLTGCWSTLLHSSEGSKIQRALGGSENGKCYLNLLLGMVGPDQDSSHPKVSIVTNAVMQAWEQGEKSLIFCFRTNTARRLREIIDTRIRAALEKRKRNCLGGEHGLRTLRSRLTGRERDLMPLGLDRVLWSFFWAWTSREGKETWLHLENLRIKEKDLRELARLAAMFGIDLLGKDIDRVFLHRSLEHAIAKRLIEERKPEREWKTLLEEIARLDWIRRPYGLTPTEDQDETGDGESAATDERGVHASYEIIVSDPSVEDIKHIAENLIERREKAGGSSIIDTAVSGPNLWLGPDPFSHAGRMRRPRGKDPNEVLSNIHHFLADLTLGDNGFDWSTRKLVLQSLRRAFLRESVLLRLLPSSTEREESGWGELLVEAFFEDLPGQKESLADRIAVFLEDLKAASGSLDDPYSARFALFDATHLRDQSFVALVDGSTKPAQRQRIFSGFNTPLLPEVLICTSVGQEGIDLHRHCRNVVHYDLAWNPAVLEQRTGRADRIGSKTFRERDVDSNPLNGPFLEVGVPFLAGTYDERMFEELRLRSQMFEVLTGGDFSVEGNIEGRDDVPEAEGESQGISYVLLPVEMVDDLRVALHVWQNCSGQTTPCSTEPMIQSKPT